MVDSRDNTDRSVPAGTDEQSYDRSGALYPAIAYACRGAIANHSAATIGVRGGQEVACVTTREQDKIERTLCYDLCFAFLPLG